jgi:hypothetical protein
VGTNLPEQMLAWAYTLANHPWDPNGAFAGIGDTVRGGGYATYGQGSILATRDRGDTWETLPVPVSATWGLWAAPD